MVLDLIAPNPFTENILLRGLGDIRDREWVMTKLGMPAQVPPDLLSRPREARLRYVLGLRDINICREVGCRVYETIDVMLRDRYRLLNPSEPRTMAYITGEVAEFARRMIPPTSATVTGISGSGKSTSVHHALLLFPRFVDHASFPGLVGPHKQVVWQSINVPPSGKADDLARRLMQNWDITNRTARFAELLAAKQFPRSTSALNEWIQVADSHFLGLLHLDEVQNLFKLSTIEQRKKRKQGEKPLGLRIVEDECLKAILELMNRGIPIVFSGTPDGMGALSKRLSTMTRIFGLGDHHLTPYDDFDFDSLCLALGKCQFLRTPLRINKDVKQLLSDLTARVPRLVMAYWIGANRIALESPDDTLRIEHIRQAEEAFFVPLRPAVRALQSGAPDAIEAYEDLVTADPTFWEHLDQKITRQLVT